jgi:cyclic beta-1,2-glucan synthetase
MADEFILEAPQSAGIPAVPPSSPPVNEHERKHPVPSREAKERLSRDAWHEASHWRVNPARSRCRDLEIKWREVVKSIEEATGELRHATSDGGSLPDAAQELADNFRLLRTALKETDHWLRTSRPLPQTEVEGERRCQMPRAYAASVAFLRATGFAFEEQALGIYFEALQEQAAFEVDELWALRPLMQLVLMEQIAISAKRFPADVDHASAGLEASHPDVGVELSRLITSLRDIGNADWKELFEQLSKTEQLLRQDPSGAYPRMDFATRDLYRRTVQELASHSQAGELEIARKVVELACGTKTHLNLEPRAIERRSHVGYYLADKGRPTLERKIGYRPPFSKAILRVIGHRPEAFYLVGFELLTIAIMTFVLSGLGTAVPIVWAFLLLLIPATESAIGVINQLVSFVFPPRPLPKLDFSHGIPDECTTMVAVPAIMINEEQVRQMVRDLEIRYLGNRDTNLHFALLTDSPDSPQPGDDRDKLVELCAQLIEGLNERYRSRTGSCFFLFHRHRVYNPSEGVWMGWERKRGKLLDLNNLLRGRYDSFPVKIGDLSVLPRIRYVITLDADTQLPRECAHRLVGTIAHPLNRAVVDAATNTVVEGYGVLQPRVGISVRSVNRSRLANIYSGETGFDLYSRAISNVYQDLVGEGSFTGKGIYEVDVFLQVLSERFPLNSILSHDLIEGAYTRSGLISDVEVIDDYPSHFRAYSRRKHRWVRGDWQIMRWLLPRVPDYTGKMVPNPINVISKWKILDNLRRSLLDSATFVLLLAGWLFLPGGPTRWTVAVLVLLLIPAYVRLLLALATVRSVENLSGVLADTGDAFIAEQVNVFMMLALLAHQALVTLDAIVRTLVRVTITHQRLLEWETAAESEIQTEKRTRVDLYLVWTPVVSLGIALLLIVLRPNALPVALPVLALWACSGAVAHWLDRPLRVRSGQILEEDKEFLRQCALRTWHFFHAFSNAQTNWLIPDNFRQDLATAVQRTSPTNVGLLLNARLAAYEFGYLTLSEFVSETEKSMATMRRLPRYNGHFFNWCDIRTLQPEEPRFISTVDSGNLLCCLWTLKQGCLQMAEGPVLGASLWEGIKDHLRLIVELARAVPHRPEAAPVIKELATWSQRPCTDPTAWLQELPELERALSRLGEALLGGTEEEVKGLRWGVEETSLRLANLRKAVGALTPWLLPEYRELVRCRELGLSKDANHLILDSLPDFLRGLDSRLEALCRNELVDRRMTPLVESLRSLIPGCIRETENLCLRLRSAAQEADTLVRHMDFSFLYNARRKVLSIGYDVTRSHLAESSYDLLASEARATAFVAIAKGDVPQESWSYLERAHTTCDGKRVLLSWSGTMFEYLMPALWMRTYPNTLLDYSLRSVVACQRKATKDKHIPWGISESAHSEKDDAGNYQYHAFGLRALALCPTMHPGLVISPYSTFLALTVDASTALKNVRVMGQMGWQGPLGYYEAADFSPTRVQKSGDYELVRCWMAHHQGMIILSICNLLRGSAIQNLFHAEPMVSATERLLHEKLPRTIPVDRRQRTFGNLREGAEHQTEVLVKEVEADSHGSEDETKSS